MYNFRATRTTAELSEEEPLSLLWLGDLGYENAQSWGHITTSVAEGMYDSAVLVGDWVRFFVLLLTLLRLSHPPANASALGVRPARGGGQAR